MDHSTGVVIGIIIAVIAACIVGGIVFGIVNTQSDATNESMKQVENMNQSALNAVYTQYDATEVTGSQVIGAIKKFENENNVISIVVNNGRGESTYVYESDLTTEATLKAKDAKNKSDLNTYINPSSMYLGEIIKDEDTDTIIGIKFEKQ